MSDPLMPLAATDPDIEAHRNALTNSREARLTDTQDRWAGLQVTNDPELEARLREGDMLSSRELAEYAHSLGLYPPGFEAGRNPSKANQTVTLADADSLQSFASRDTGEALQR